MTESRLLTVEEAARYLSFSPRTIYNRIAKGSKDPFPVKPIRMGKSVRFDRKDLDDYVDKAKGISKDVNFSD